MKKIWIYILAVILFAVVSFAFTERAEEDASRYGVYEYTWTADTITDTEADTLTVPPLLLSKWSPNYSVKLTKATGTPNCAIKVEESNVRSGDEWYSAAGGNLNDAAISGFATDTVSVTGLGLGSDYPIGGVRQRVIITGTGTQSTLYTIKVTLKKDQ